MTVAPRQPVSTDELMQHKWAIWLIVGTVLVSVIVVVILLARKWRSSNSDTKESWI